MSVQRLPQQHKTKPHCPNCARDLPTLNGVDVVTTGDPFGECRLLAITYRVLCPCGSEWDMQKKVSAEDIGAAARPQEWEG